MSRLKLLQIALLAFGVAFCSALSACDYLAVGLGLA